MQVLRCEKSTDGGHINYVYEAALSNQKWLVPPLLLTPDCPPLAHLTGAVQVKRRYSDFEKLHESLCRRFRKIKNQMPQLPKTAWYTLDCLVYYRLSCTPNMMCESVWVNMGCAGHWGVCGPMWGV